MRTSTRTLLALAATVSLTATAAACGDDASDGSTVITAVTDSSENMTEDTTTGTTADSMSDMATDTTTADSMSDMATDTTTADSMADMGTDTTPADSIGEGDMAEASVDDGASTLRATLTSLLQEHVYLAGVAFETAVDAGGDMEEANTAAAVAALDENTVALADAVGSIAGDDNGAAFLELWRQHIGFFVDYTLGEATGDQAMKDQALTDLEGYQQAAGAFFEEITGGTLAADETVSGLEEHVATLTAAIDSIVAGDTDAFDNLKAAADHMSATALYLSSGIVEALPDMFPGSTTSAPAEVRATLTAQLQEHAYLAGIAIEQAIEAGGDLEAPAVQAAIATLDSNTVQLSETVASVAGEDNGTAFQELWRQHIGFFVDYTLGEATGDDAMKQQALTDLEGYQQAAGAFFEEITGGEIAPDMLIPGLQEHVKTLTLAIDGFVAGDTAAFSDLRAAGQHMPKAALLLSTGIVAATS
ncbi:MAG: copper amine oxidase [Ilumatobacteraceae bacterium]